MLRKMIFFVCALMACSAQAKMTYAPYSCEYIEARQGQWSIIYAVWMEKENNFGWNQIHSIAQQTSQVDRGPEAGSCSFLDISTPDIVTLTTRVVRGKDLELASGGCAYTGSRVQFEDESHTVPTNEFVTSRKFELGEGAQKVTFLNITGIRPRGDLGEEDVFARCQQEFEKATGLKASLATKKLGERLHLQIQRRSQPEQKAWGFTIRE